MKRQTDPDVRLLQGAADPTRLAILRQLSTASEVCACDFTACCDVSQPTVSHHLKVLTETGWVDSERRGSWVWYRIRPDAVSRLARLLGQVTPGITAPAGSLMAGTRRLPVLDSAT
jgi:ArsR family transcriptional regulator